MPTSIRYQQERAELEMLLASGIFSKAPTLAQFITYVCGKYFDGEADQIKEYNIAVEALGRPPDFNQAKDSIVRVEAHRVRKRLKQYYETEGAGHQIHIVMNPGKYVPEFVVGQADSLPIAPSETGQTASRPQMRRYLPAIAAGCAVILLAGLSLLSKPPAPRAAAPAAPKPIPNSEKLSPALAVGSEIRVLAGSSVDRYVDFLGHTWQGDRYFTGGEVRSTPVASIRLTHDPRMFQSQREGSFRYDIPLKPGSYELRMYFAETEYGEGNRAGGGETSRIFTIRANERPILTDFDVISDAGGGSTADIKVFKDISPAEDGKLHLRFPAQVGKPFVNAIEILPSLPGRMRPVRIVARNSSYVDNEGRAWSADHFYEGGQMVLREDPVSGSPDPGVYRGERFGHFTYVIPVAAGRYTVILRFAETWFGPDRIGSARGAEGSRRFDVFCNRKLLLNNFDIFKEAGGNFRAVERKFSGLEPNAQGKLTLSFVPLSNYACINAIEVIDEAK